MPPRMQCSTLSPYAQGIDLREPNRDYHGEEMSFHTLSGSLAGAGRERRAHAAWPLIGWAAGPTWEGLVDHSMGGRVYVHREGSGASGERLREALANGQLWQAMRVGAAAPPWLNGWSQPIGVSENVDFGPGAGRTFGEPQFEEPGYYDVCTTALRLGRRTFLIITNSRDRSRTLTFRPGGKHWNLTPESSAAVTTTSAGRLSISFDDIGAVVVRITHGSIAP